MIPRIHGAPDRRRRHGDLASVGGGHPDPMQTGMSRQLRHRIDRTIGDIGFGKACGESRALIRLCDFADNAVQGVHILDARIVAVKTFICRQAGLLKHLVAEARPFAFVLNGNENARSVIY